MLRLSSWRFIAFLIDFFVLVVLRFLQPSFVLPRQCLRVVWLGEDVVVKDVDVCVSESFTVGDDLFPFDILVVDDELEEDDGFVGSNASNCSLGCW